MLCNFLRIFIETHSTNKKKAKRTRVFATPKRAAKKRFHGFPVSDRKTLTLTPAAIERIAALAHQGCIWCGAPVLDSNGYILPKVCLDHLHAEDAPDGLAKLRGFCCARCNTLEGKNKKGPNADSILADKLGRKLLNTPDVKRIRLAKHVYSRKCLFPK